MATEIECAGCRKHMGTLRDAKVRNGMVVYCQECDTRNKRLLLLAQATATHKDGMPDFMRGLFGKGKAY